MLTSLTRIARAVGLHGEFLATPNYVQTVLWKDDPMHRRVNLAVSSSGDFDLARLIRVSEVADSVSSGDVSPSRGLARLREIERAPDIYGPMQSALAFIVCSASFAVLLRNGPMGILLSGALGLVSFLVAQAGKRWSRLAAVVELVAAMLTSLLALVATAYLPGTSPMSVAVCAIIVFVPGFGITIAPSELIVRNTLSGLIWLANAGATALKLIAGSALGFALVERGWANVAPTATPESALPAGWEWVAVPGVLLSLAVLFKTPSRSFLGIVIGGWIVWGAIGLGDKLGFWEGTFLGATLLMIYGGWYSLRRREPSVVIVLPCVMILLPGVGSLQALYLISTEGGEAGLSSAIEVVVLVLAIIGGSIVGDVLAPPNLLKTGRRIWSLPSRVLRR